MRIAQTRAYRLDVKFAMAHRSAKTIPATRDPCLPHDDPGAGYEHQDPHDEDAFDGPSPCLPL